MLPCAGGRCLQGAEINAEPLMKPDQYYDGATATQYLTNLLPIDPYLDSLKMGSLGDYDGAL